MSLFNHPETTKSPAHHSQTRQSKVERYGWVVIDEPGKHESIDKNRLKIDERYQRKVVTSKVKLMAARWSWMACGSILVARRGHMNYVYDGQNRVAAAMQRSDITFLPCLVFKTGEVVEEAQAFLDANTGRRAVTAIEKFNALLVTRDKPAALVAKLIADSGLVISQAKHPGTVKCVSCLMNWARLDAGLLTAVWPLIVELTADAPGVHEIIVDSVCYIERGLRSLKPEEGEIPSLLVSPWRDRLLALGYRGTLDGAQNAAAYYKKGGARVWADGVITSLNKHVRNRLVLPER